MECSTIGSARGFGPRGYRFDPYHSSQLNSKNKRKNQMSSPYKRGRPSKFNPTTGEGKSPPNVAGEYRIATAKGIRKYIGETSNLSRRMNEHIRDRKIRKNQSFAWQLAKLTSTSRTRRDHERNKIDKHNPLGNKRRGGGGRPAKSFVERSDS